MLDWLIIKSVSVIIPAYNEEQNIARTIESLHNQTRSPDKIIVIDDYSSDQTGKIAQNLGATVLRPPNNQGSKAKAQNYALPYVDTDYTVAIDADTSLEVTALEEMVRVMEDSKIVAACSFVIPGKIGTIWERGRFIEYMFAFTFYKEVQEWYGKPLICSGCFSIYRTEVLKEFGGWQTRTLAEDMDLTWSFYAKNKKVKFNGKALCYPIEPHNLDFLGKQLKRWSHGFIQNVVFHWKELIRIPGLREQVLVGFVDAITTGLIYFIITPIFLIINPILIVYLLGADVLFIAVPVFWKGYKLKMLGKTILSLPFYFVLRIVNSLYFFEALFSELLLNKSFKTYMKGH
jgi:poly-beta-1,6-N-acetyl-D-glucosamine synthase